MSNSREIAESGRLSFDFSGFCDASKLAGKFDILSKSEIFDGSSGGSDLTPGMAVLGNGRLFPKRPARLF